MTEGTSWLQAYHGLVSPAIETWVRFYQTNPGRCAVDVQPLSDECFAALAVTNEGDHEPIKGHVKSRVLIHLAVVNRSPGAAVAITYALRVQNGSMRFSGETMGFHDDQTINHHAQGRQFVCVPSMDPSRATENFCPSSLMLPHTSGDETVFCDIYPASGTGEPLCLLMVGWSLAINLRKPPTRRNKARAAARNQKPASAVKLAVAMKDFTGLRKRLAHHVRGEAIIRCLDDFDCGHLKEKCSERPLDEDKWHAVIEYYIGQEPPNLMQLAGLLQRLTNTPELARDVAPDLHQAIDKLVESGVLPVIN